jgi:hypothetical protein
MKQQPKHYTPEEKVAVLRRHLLEKEPILKLCDEVGLQPHGLLPLAEGVVRERCVRLRAADRVTAACSGVEEQTFRLDAVELPGYTDRNDSFRPCFILLSNAFRIRTDSV